MNCGFINIFNIYILMPYILFPILWLLTFTFLLSRIFMGFHESTILIDWDIIFIGRTPIKITIILDWISTTYATIIIFISTNVLKFSRSYIKDDLFINRFTILVLIFILSINLLIFIPNFIALLLGWDGLGITSFILVIYYQNPTSLGAGIITALTNRLGDAIILIAIALTLNQGHWHITIINSNSANLFIQILIITVAAITKRAQIPFSRWLPAAIAAPTPVSALVHSSTLVTAGIFILIRFYPFLSSIKIFHYFAIFTGITTILIAGIRAIIENDIKKIIALSTLRQLGLIITSLGLGLPILTFFHITTHAIFKALLFITAGTLISSHSHNQDFRLIGNITNQNIITRSCIIISNIALCGIPFLAGFYSKDLIFEWINSSISLYITSVAFYIGISLTIIYSIRISIIVIWAPRISSPIYPSLEQNSSIHSILTMSSISISRGAILLWLAPIELIRPSPVLFTPNALLIIGIIISTLIIISKNTSITSNYTPYQFLSFWFRIKIWFLTNISSQLQLFIPIKWSHLALKDLDHSWIELIRAQGTYQLNSSIGNRLIFRRTGTPVFLATLRVLSRCLLVCLFIVLVI